ncbi:tetratricopeptide repeat protein [Pseudodesulfovibrio pelocollis]|uniref:tetratricopeptide repeat protein n=1 Tax=Pseudodesulfovibrio pelocollis TaxID=3051432 RepID=UPI00255A7134|nr:tetratricopeptide repeat protein [Pseudodesulfovibrio sp. SB368]
MAEKKIDRSRRDFLMGAVRRFRREENAGPAASTAACIDVMKQANALYVDEQWEEARQKYRQCLEDDKSDADVRYRLGVCLYRTGMYRQAKLEFERALRLRREYMDAFLYLGLTMVRLERPDKALGLWKRYFNPGALAVQRELNLQVGLMEEGVTDPPQTIAEAVEKAIAQAGHAVG